MGRKLLFFFIVFTLSSCRFFDSKVNFFENVDFKEKADWLLIHKDNYDFVELIHDHKILNKYKNDLILKPSDACSGSTPDYCFSLYKNGLKLKSHCYCDWEPLSVSLGRLKDKFIKGALKKTEAYSIQQHDFILDSLSALKNIYLLYPKDTIINFPDQLKFAIKLKYTGQDIFEQEKPIEKEFSEIFKNGNFNVKADFYSSEVNPERLGYHISVDCDSSFLKIFNKTLLSDSQFFRNITNYEYSKKRFEIYFYEWDI